MSETLVEEDDKVKMFDHFIEDLKTLANRYREREGRHG